MATGGQTSFMQEIKNSATCCICQEIFTDPRALPCLHVFCKKCLDQHLEVWTRSRKVRCPLCCTEATVPGDGAQGFPAAFLQANQVEIYNKMMQLNLGQSQNMSCTLCSDDDIQSDAVKFCLDCTESLCGRCNKIHTKLQPSHTTTPSAEITQQKLVDMLKEQKESKCKIHQKKFSIFCETCNQLICDSCSVVPHKEHSKISLEAAYGKHKLELENFIHEIMQGKSCHEVTLQQAKKAYSHVQKQKQNCIKKIDNQEQLLILTVKQHAHHLRAEVVKTAGDAENKVQNVIDTLQKELSHTQGCMEYVDFCFKKGTKADVVNTSTENVANFQSTLQELKKPHPIPKFDMSVQCSSVADFTLDKVAKVKSTCRCEVYPSKTVITKVPLQLTSKKVLVWYPSPVSFIAMGISCTPNGNIVICDWGRPDVEMHTKDQKKIRTLEVPDGTEAMDVECTNTNIYVTDQSKEAVHIFNLAGDFHGSKRIKNIKGIAGISIQGNTTYLTGAHSHAIYKVDLNQSSNVLTPTRFAENLKLNQPMFVCAKGNSVAVSSYNNHCVHMLDTQGNLKFTHGTIGQAGKQAHQMCNALGVAIDSEDRLLVADQANDRVCVLSEEGTVLGHILVYKRDEISYPKGLVVDNEGHLLGVCYHRVVKYQYSLQ